MELYDRQQLDLAMMIARKKAGLWSDAGTGKTPPACLFIYYVWNTHKGKTLWGMPTHLMGKNKDELLLWSNFKSSEIAIINGTKKEKDAMKADPNVKVWIMSFSELIKNAKSYKGVKCVALDEPQKYFSNDGSPSTQKLYDIVDALEFFMPMSGTLNKGRLDSAYPMLRLIDRRFYGSYQDFINQHSIKDDWGTIRGWRNHEKLAQVMELTGRRTSFEEAYGKRNIIYYIETVDMNPAQQAIYDEFKASGAVELDRVILEGANEGVNVLRLRQILAHPEKLKVPTKRDENKKIIEYEERSIKGVNERDERLKLHVEEHIRTGEPFVVVSTLIPEQERLYKMIEGMGVKVALINSTVPNTARFKIDKEFQSGVLQCVVGSPSTMGTGFNWRHLDHIIFCARDFAADDFIQMLMRAFREAREKALRVTLIEYRNSVEQGIDRVLDMRSRDMNAVDDSYLVLNLAPEHRTKAENVYYN